MLVVGTAFMSPNKCLRLMKMSLPTDFAEWTICDPVAAKSGGKTSAVLGAKGEPICFTLPALRSPFDASAYNDETATRVNLSLELTSDNKDIVDWCSELDAEMMKTCRQNSRRIFGKDMYLESDLRSMYLSPLRVNEEYGTNLLKMRMNKGTGRHAVRIWNKGGLKRDPPESWAGLTVQCRVVLKSLWLQSRSFGLTFEVTDAMIIQEDVMVDCLFTVDSE